MNKMYSVFRSRRLSIVRKPGVHRWFFGSAPGHPFDPFIIEFPGFGINVWPSQPRRLDLDRGPNA